ncbi:hypothetical protein [Spongiimicrobium salis]|uniref:hypothetical protein n=1 Tax=Spongiimicrobium salis TaxID=1667022 RepID=UPI00374D4E9D
MKTKALILLASLVLLSSCDIVKSLKAFYIPEAVSYQKAFVGEWTDKQGTLWKVISFRDAYEKETKNEKVSKEDVQLFEKYKDGYFVQYGEEDNQSVFIAMPFSIDDTIFMDFVPFDFKLLNSSSNLIKKHLVATHSVAKFDILEGQKIQITWLDEDRLEALFEQQKIQIKHEILGLEETLLLTASSEELYRFLKKYNASSLEDKWKSDEKLLLTPADAKP